MCAGDARGLICALCSIGALFGAAYYTFALDNTPPPLPVTFSPVVGPTAVGRKYAPGKGRWGKKRSTHGRGRITAGKKNCGRGAAKWCLESAKPGRGFQPLLQAPIGQNLSSDALISSCPSREYHRCYQATLERRYPVAKFRTRRPPKMKKGICEPAGDPGCAPIGPSRILEWFDGSAMPSCPPLPMPAQKKVVDCANPDAAMQAQLLLLVGVPSAPTATGRMRRAAIRDAWMQDERVGRSVAVCFLLSSQTPAPELARLREEEAAHHDMLLLDVPETPLLITQPTEVTRSGSGPTLSTVAQPRAIQRLDAPGVGLA